MMFDRNSRFSFVLFAEHLPYEAAQILSSPEFFAENCSRPVRRARSCEIWAVTLTAFDGAGFVVRSSADAPEMVFGNLDVVVPAVMVLRQRPQ